MEAILRNSELANSLSFNIGVLANHLVKLGFSKETIDQVISDCHKLMKDRIKQVDGIQPWDAVNMERVAVMVILHSFIEQDLGIIKKQAAIKGVPEEEIASEWVKDTIERGMPDKKESPGRKVPVE